MLAAVKRVSRSVYERWAPRVQAALKVVASNPVVKRALRYVLDVARARGVQSAVVALNSILPGLGVLFAAAVETLFDFCFGPGAEVA